MCVYTHIYISISAYHSISSLYMKIFTQFTNLNYPLVHIVSGDVAVRCFLIHPHRHIYKINRFIWVNYNNSLT